MQQQFIKKIMSVLGLILVTPLFAVDSSLKKTITRTFTCYSQRKLSKRSGKRTIIGLNFHTLKNLQKNSQEVSELIDGVVLQLKKLK